MAGYLCPMPNGIFFAGYQHPMHGGICPCLCIPPIMLPLFPRALSWAGGSLPLSGAYLSERLLLMGIADVRVRYTRISNSVERDFVK